MDGFIVPDATVRIVLPDGDVLAWEGCHAQIHAVGQSHLPYHAGLSEIPPGESVTIFLTNAARTAPEFLPPAKQMARAVLAEQEDCALALADEVRLAYLEGPNFVSREELVAMLRRLEHVDAALVGPAQMCCPLCYRRRLEDSPSHAPDCPLAHLLDRVDALQNH